MRFTHQQMCGLYGFRICILTIHSAIAGHGETLDPICEFTIYTISGQHADLRPYHKWFSGTCGQQETDVGGAGSGMFKEGLSRKPFIIWTRRSIKTPNSCGLTVNLLNSHEPYLSIFTLPGTNMVTWMAWPLWKTMKSSTNKGFPLPCVSSKGSKNPMNIHTRMGTRMGTTIPETGCFPLPC